MDWSPLADTAAFSVINCPLVVPPAETLPDSLTAIVGWTAHKLWGADLQSLEDWATSATASQRLSYAIKGRRQGPGAV